MVRTEEGHWQPSRGPIEAFAPDKGTFAEALWMLDPPELMDRIRDLERDVQVRHEMVCQLLETVQQLTGEKRRRRERLRACLATKTATK